MCVAFSSSSYSCYGASCIIRSSSLVNDHVKIFFPSRRKKVQVARFGGVTESSSGLEEASIKTSPDEAHQQRIRDIITRQTKSISTRPKVVSVSVAAAQYDLEEAYEECKRICERSSKTTHLATLLMPKEQQRAVWAIYAWGRRVDDVVDGNDSIRCDVVDEYQTKLEDTFSGRPHDSLDAALLDAVSKFHLDIEPFKDLMEGMRMDTYKNRYANFEELYLYCYYVAGTSAFMGMPVLGIAQRARVSPEKIYESALSFTIGCQLTHILRDVAEDAERGRVYLPLDELARFGLTDEDVLERRISNGWREFTKLQIKRARLYFKLAEEGASQVDKVTRLSAWLIVIKYKMILDKIEENNYDNLTKRVDVSFTEGLLSLPLAYLRAHHFT